MSEFELVLYAVSTAVIVFAFNWKGRRDSAEVENAILERRLVQLTYASGGPAPSRGFRDRARHDA